MLRIAVRLCLGFMLGATRIGPVAAQTFANLDLLWVEPAAPAGHSRPCARLLTAELPRDWLTGDAAVILIAPPTLRFRENEASRLRQALLHEDAALLEYPGGPAEGCHAAPPTLVGEVLGALRALIDQGRVGLVVAIGLEDYGDAVLNAAAETVAAELLGPQGPRLAAAIAIDAPGRARFAAGPSPAAAEQWPQRGRMLCRAVAAAMGLDGPRPCFAGLGLEEPPRILSADHR